MATQIEQGPIEVELAWLEPGCEVVARLGAHELAMSTTEARKLASDLVRAANAVDRAQGKPKCPSCGGTDTHTSGCAR